LDENGQPKMSKAALKKQKKLEELALKKAQREKELAARAEEEKGKKLEASKSIKIEEDTSLPKAEATSVKDARNFLGKRVVLRGWVNNLRAQGGMMFLELRDGTGVPNILQCVLTGNLAKVYDAVTLNREASVVVYGTLVENEKAKQSAGLELQVDFWRLVGFSPSEIENVYNSESASDLLLDQRHLVLREQKNVYIMRVRSHVLNAFRQHFIAKEWYEVTPPCIVQTQVEGGSTLFKFDYFGEPAYLTQSSQLYLETMVPVLGKVFCCMPSFRAEKSRTRRHLSEYTHFEGELGFINFDDLLETLEDMIVGVAERMLKTCKAELLAINPEFKIPKRPFRRMPYADAIKWLNEHNIDNEETKAPFKYGEDIPEGPERKMTDTIGEPIFLCRFPTDMKPFYMHRSDHDQSVTDSVDLLMPGVGEIIGGSMRAWNLEQVLNGFKREGINPDTYYWYNDLRKYGSVPHGGWGLGVERYLTWIMNLNHIRDVCVYPRFTGRAQP
jgi:asparaginyl-tRNA synthetase